MLRQFDLIVFDWDGTLFDSTASIAYSIQAAARDLRYSVPTLERARHVIGLGLSDALAYAVPDLRTQDVQAFIARYRYHYSLQEENICLYEGAHHLLDAITAAGLPMAIATGKSSAGLARVLKISGLERHFAATRCADQTHPKPHPAMLLEIMERLQSTPERTLMIGDTTHDMQMAKSAKTSAVALTHGAHQHADLNTYKPLALLDSLPALYRWLIEEKND